MHRINVVSVENDFELIPVEVVEDVGSYEGIS
jgi:hypothetical protein